MEPYEILREAPASPKKRDPAIDMARIFALASVPSIHFYAYNDFYSQNQIGIRMFLMTVHKSSLMVCVPLFIVLTGYLSCNKKLSRSCYSGLGKNLITYVLASAACILYRLLVHINMTFSWAFFSFLNYTAAPYSWYVEMYIGLAILSPFLNILYYGLTTKKQKQWLIVAMLLLTAVPCIFNTYDFLTDGWWKSPSISENFQKIIPSWWVSSYPLSYYFIGCYLKEYPPKIKKRWLFLIYGVVSLLFGAYSFYRSDGGPYYWGAYHQWYSLPTVILTVSCFVFFMNIPTSNFPSWLRKILAKLSDLCLGAYLLSWIFDSILYPRLNAAVPDMQLRMNWFFLIVPTSILLSFALSYVLSLIQKGLERGVQALRKNAGP